MKGTALKAYLKHNNIRQSFIAKECHLNEGYLSKLLNTERSNPSISVLLRLATVLDVPLELVKKYLRNSYDSYILENAPEVLTEKSLQEQFNSYLQQILDASDQSDLLTVAKLNKVICEVVPESVQLKSNYIHWYEAYNLAFQNKFESSIPLFIEAANFTPRYELERRFKSKILLGLAGSYMVRGKYQKGIRAFRQSLFLWDKGFHAARINMNLGTLYRRLAKYEHSISAYNKAYELGTSPIKLYAISGLIQVYLDKEDYNSARKYVLIGYNEAKKLDSVRSKSDLYCTIAEYYSTIGNLHRAEVFFRKTILFACDSGNIRTKQWAELELAIFQLRQGLVKEFDDLTIRLESELTGLEDILLTAKLMNALGRRHLDRGEYSLVIQAEAKAYMLLVSFSSPPIKKEFIKCCEILYEAYIDLHKPDIASFYLNVIKKIKKK